MGLEKWEAGWEIPSVNDTLLREKNQITLPTEIVEAAGLTPTKDRINWRFESGEIRGRKLDIKQVRIVRPRRIKGRLRGADVKLSQETIAAAVRADRDER